MQGQPVLTADGTTMFRLDAWLEKVASRSDVISMTRDSLEIRISPPCTGFYAAGRMRVPGQEAVSELEVELVTGRTHQIRAHLAHIGHPLLGDGKYGRNAFNKAINGHDGPLKRQQLSAVSITFPPKIEGPLATVAGRTFQIEAEYDWLPS